MKADVVVVGAGLGGLSAAMILASRGLDVVVVDAAERAGGKANIVTVDGVECDTGPSVVTLLDVIDGAFRAAGTSLEDELTVCIPEGGMDIRFPDAQFVIGHGLEGALEGIEAGLGAEARDEAAQFLEATRSIWDEVAPEFVLGEAPRALSLWRLGPRKWMRLLKADPFRSMFDAIQAQVRNPHLQALFARFATYNGSDPRRAPATLNCIAWVEMGLGVYGFEGGLYSLVRAAVGVCERHGVDLRLGTAVEAITRDNAGVTGVRLADGTTIEARAVVSNADVRHLTETLLPGSVSVSGELSTSGWTGILRNPRSDLAAHAVLFNGRYMAEFEDLFDEKRTPRDPTVYLCAQEKAHRRTGWADEEPVFVMVNAPAGGKPVNGVRERAIARLVEHGVAEPDVEVVWERTPFQLASRFPGSRGSLYGSASNSRFAAFQRPATDTSVPGLFLATGSAHPGGGVPLVVQSGRLAAGHVLTALGLERGVA